MNETNTKELYELLEEKRNNKEDYTKKLEEGLANFSSNYINNPNNEMPKSETNKEVETKTSENDSFLNTTMKILAEKNLLEKGLNVLEKLATSGKLNINNYTQNTQQQFKYTDRAGFDITKEQYEEAIKEGRSSMVSAIPLKGTPMVIHNEQPLPQTQPISSVPEVTQEDLNRMLEEKQQEQINFAKNIIMSYTNTLTRVNNLKPDIKINEIIPVMVDELETCLLNGNDFVAVYERMCIKQQETKEDDDEDDEDEKPKPKTTTKKKKNKKVVKNKDSEPNIEDD